MICTRVAVAVLLLHAASVQAQLFPDNEARKAVLELRATDEAQAKRLTELTAANKELLATTTAEALDAALTALRPLGALVDELVDAGATASLESTATTVRDAVAALTA